MKRYQVIGKWHGQEEGVLDSFDTSSKAVKYAEKIVEEENKEEKHNRSNWVPMYYLLVYDKADDIVIKEWKQ